MMWQRYCRATGSDPSSLLAVEHFGDSVEMADQLLGLVLSGTKSATACLAQDYTEAGEELPRAGGHWIIVDGQGAPRCVVRSVDVRLGLLASVDDAFAHDEGEGERTRDWWLDAHRRFFTRRAERGETPFDDERDVVVFERFEVVWTESYG